MPTRPSRDSCSDDRAASMPSTTRPSNQTQTSLRCTIATARTLDGARPLASPRRGMTVAVEGTIRDVSKWQQQPTPLHRLGRTLSDAFDGLADVDSRTLRFTKMDPKPRPSWVLTQASYEKRISDVFDERRCTRLVQRGLSSPQARSTGRRLKRSSVVVAGPTATCSSACRPPKATRRNCFCFSRIAPRSSDLARSGCDSRQRSKRHRRRRDHRFLALIPVYEHGFSATDRLCGARMHRLSARDLARPAARPRPVGECRRTDSLEGNGPGSGRESGPSRHFPA